MLCSEPCLIQFVNLLDISGDKFLHGSVRYVRYSFYSANYDTKNAGKLARTVVVGIAPIERQVARTYGGFAFVLSNLLIL